MGRRTRSSRKPWHFGESGSTHIGWQSIVIPIMIIIRIKMVTSNYSINTSSTYYTIHNEMFFLLGYNFFLPVINQIVFVPYVTAIVASTLCGRHCLLKPSFVLREKYHFIPISIAMPPQERKSISSHMREEKQKAWRAHS